MKTTATALDKILQVSNRAVKYYFSYGPLKLEQTRSFIYNTLFSGSVTRIVQD